MIDTIGIRYTFDPPGQAEVRAFASQGYPKQYVRADKHTFEDGTEIETNWQIKANGLGNVHMYKRGALSFEGSIVKMRQRLLEGRDEKELNNADLLTAEEVNETFQAVTEQAENMFPFLDPARLEVVRADISYDRKVSDTMTVLRSLRGAIRPTRLGDSWFDNRKGEATGLMCRGKAVVFRAYDKGIELRRKEYQGVLRTEEQLRRDAKAMGEILDLRSRMFDREACRDTLNNRFLDVGFDEEINYDDLIANGEYAVALFVAKPELLPIYKETVSKQAYYKLQRKIKTIRARAIPDDLRLPESAWLEKVA